MLILAALARAVAGDLVLEVKVVTFVFAFVFVGATAVAPNRICSKGAAPVLFKANAMPSLSSSQESAPRRIGTLLFFSADHRDG